MISHVSTVVTYLAELGGMLDSGNTGQEAIQLGLASLNPPDLCAKWGGL